MKCIVPFVNFPLAYQKIKPEIDEAIQKCLDRGDFILRDEVERFEKNLVEFVGSKYAVGLNSGTDALIFSLKAIGIQPGDEVIVPAYTFAATIAAVVHCGATPIVVDIGDNLLIDPKEIEKAVTVKTKAIIPVHLAGAVCDMKEIMRIAQYHGLIVVEDAAQALGVKRVKGFQGLISCFSFYPAKILGAYGDGGAIATNKKEIAEKIRFLRHAGRNPENEIIYYGFTSRLDNIQAAILNVKFKYLPQYIKRRQEIAKLYDQGLNGIKQIKLPISEVYQDYTIRIEDRDNFMEYLKFNGIETISGYCSMPFSTDHFKNTNRANKQALRLPICPELSNEQVEYVIKKIKEFYEK